MKAGMFLAGLGSGAAQGYMMGKMMKKDAASTGTPESEKTLAPVSDAAVKKVDQTAGSAQVPSPSGAEQVPDANAVSTPAKKRSGTGVTQEYLVSQSEEYKKGWEAA